MQPAYDAGLVSDSETVLHLVPVRLAGRSHHLRTYSLQVSCYRVCALRSLLCAVPGLYSSQPCAIRCIDIDILLVRIRLYVPARIVVMKGQPT